jgi:hypothetical protein
VWRPARACKRRHGVTAGPVVKVSDCQSIITSSGFCQSGSEGTISSFDSFKVREIFFGYQYPKVHID